MGTEVEYDPQKNERNIQERGISFEQVRRFEWSSALMKKDDRANYGEDRYQALGLVEGRLHMLVFTPRGSAVRVISFRKANKREVKAYEQAKLGTS